MSVMMTEVWRGREYPLLPYDDAELAERHRQELRRLFPNHQYVLRANQPTPTLLSPGGPTPVG